MEEKDWRERGGRSRRKKRRGGRVEEERGERREGGGRSRRKRRGRKGQVGGGREGEEVISASRFVLFMWLSFVAQWFMFPRVLSCASLNLADVLIRAGSP